MKVLNILETLDQGGIETFILNNYTHLTNRDIQYDYLIMQVCNNPYVSQCIQKHGGKIYKYTKCRLIGWRHFYNVYQTIKKHGPYEAVQAHCMGLNGLILLAAFAAGVPKRFSFVHVIARPVSNPIKRLYGFISRCLLELFATRKFACSTRAGKSVYVGKFRVFNNAIDTQKFKFNPAVRAHQRQLLGVQDKFVIVHTARFSPEKNQLFSLQVLKALRPKCPQARLIFCGDGALLETVKQQAQAWGLEQAVCFLGAVPNVHEVLQAADVFLLPSTWEALGLAAIEAQGAGLPCILADNIPPEAFVVNAYPLALKAGAPAWAEQVLTLRGFPRKDTSDILVQAGFDIRTTAGYLQEEYAK